MRGYRAKPFSTRREVRWKQRRPRVPVRQKTGLDHDSRDPQFDLPPVRQDFDLRCEGRRSLSGLAARPLHCRCDPETNPEAYLGIVRVRLRPAERALRARLPVLDHTSKAPAHRWASGHRAINCRKQLREFVPTVLATDRHVLRM